MSQAPVRLGLSACYFHADPKRAVFKGKTLLYVEQSIASWVMSTGALAYMIPAAAGPVKLQHLLAGLDGLVLQGGSDVSPKSYGEEPLRPEWAGDYVRDCYEIELVKLCMAANKPVLGICRGAQLINVAIGGTLYQDIQTQRPEALVHRDWEIYDQNFHDVELTAGGHLARLYGGRSRSRVNSVHHQAAKDLGRDLVVEARAVPDGIVEALRLVPAGGGGPYVLGVQWHPEFQDPADAGLLPTQPLLQDFLGEVERRR